MSKLTIEKRIIIYEKRKQGRTVSSLGLEFGVSQSAIKYLIRLIDKHGYSILREDKNNYYSIEFKKEAINRVLINGETLNEVSIDMGLSNIGLISSWIRKYKEMGYNVIENKRGRKTSMAKETKKNYEEMSAEEKIKFLENKNIYLEAENAYLKKLGALIQLEDQKRKK